MHTPRAPNTRMFSLSNHKTPHPIFTQVVAKYSLPWQALLLIFVFTCTYLSSCSFTWIGSGLLHTATYGLHFWSQPALYWWSTFLESTSTILAVYISGVNQYYTDGLDFYSPSALHMWPVCLESVLHMWPVCLESVSIIHVTLSLIHI